jgi:hypothetical protein
MIYWYIARLSFNGHSRMKVIFSSMCGEYVPGDKIVKVFPRGDRISLKILKSCGKEYPIEADKALRRNGECFPFNISDIETF